MTSMSWQKMNYRGGISPASPMSIHIYKDPPKSIFTRKKERVNIAEVQYMVQADNPYGDPTRINEGIQMYQRGQNPMVEVSYQNAGLASSNSAFGGKQVSNPYKLDAIRMPIDPIALRVPLSNPRTHQNYTITTNPSIVPQTIAGEYDKQQVRLITSGYTLPMGTVKSNMSTSVQKNQERYAEVMARALNNLLQGNLQSNQSLQLDLTRESNTKELREIKDITPITAVPNLSMRIDSKLDETGRQFREIKDDQLSVSATPTLSFSLDKTRDSNGAIRANVVKEIKPIVVSPVWSYDLNPTRDASTKYVTETKDLTTIAATSPITFTGIVVHDPRTNTNIQVEANIKDKNTIAVVAAAGAPLIFNTNDGQTVKLKDYDYKVVTAAAGNTQMIVYVRQPDIVLDRASPLYAVNSNLMLQGIDNSAQRAAAEAITLQSVLPFVTATSSISLKGYNENGTRLTNDASLHNLQNTLPLSTGITNVSLKGYNENGARLTNDASMHNLQNTLPLVSGTTNVALKANGYNEEIARDSKVKELDKLSNFGSFEDRVAKPNFAIRG